MNGARQSKEATAQSFHSFQLITITHTPVVRTPRTLVPNDHSVFSPACHTQMTTPDPYPQSPSPRRPSSLAATRTSSIVKNCRHNPITGAFSAHHTLPSRFFCSPTSSAKTQVSQTTADDGILTTWVADDDAQASVLMAPQKNKNGGVLPKSVVVANSSGG